MNDKPTPIKAQVPPPPPPQRRGILAAVPVTQEPTENLRKANSGLQDMNFKVDPEFHMAFKSIGAMRGMSMKDLLEACFTCWVEQYGDHRVKAIYEGLPKK